MPHTPGHISQGTRIDQPIQIPQANTPKEQCRLDGGFWDEQTQTCIPKDLSAIGQEPKKDPREQELIKQFKAGGRPSDIPTGVALTREQSARLRAAQEFEASKQGGLSAQQGILIQEQRAIQQAEGQAFAGQVGQFGQLGISPTGFDFAEAGVAGLRTAIPASIGTAATVFGAATLGAKLGGATGTIAAPGIGTAIGAALGFTGGIVAGILSNMNSQRTDTTTAQQRVLDEGKQVLSDWRTLAESNPARRQEAITGFNAQLALIDQAYRQMKLDTSRDLGKFETALPNLAEFEAFYSNQGERDFLIAEMILALRVPNDINFAMLELASRRTWK